MTNLNSWLGAILSYIFILLLTSLFWCCEGDVRFSGDPVRDTNTDVSNNISHELVSSEVNTSTVEFDSRLSDADNVRLSNVTNLSPNSSMRGVKVPLSNFLLAPTQHNISQHVSFIVDPHALSATNHDRVLNVGAEVSINEPAQDHNKSDQEVVRNLEEAQLTNNFTYENENKTDDLLISDFPDVNQSPMVENSSVANESFSNVLHDDLQPDFDNSTMTWISDTPNDVYENQPFGLELNSAGLSPNYFNYSVDENLFSTIINMPSSAASTSSTAVSVIGDLNNDTLVSIGQEVTNQTAAAGEGEGIAGEKICAYVDEGNLTALIQANTVTLRLNGLAMNEISDSLISELCAVLDDCLSLVYCTGSSFRNVSVVFVGTARLFMGGVEVAFFVRNLDAKNVLLEQNIIDDLLVNITYLQSKLSGILHFERQQIFANRQSDPLNDPVLVTGLVAGLVTICVLAVISMTVLVCYHYRRAQHSGEWIVNKSGRTDDAMDSWCFENDGFNGSLLDGSYLQPPEHMMHVDEEHNAHGNGHAMLGQLSSAEAIQLQVKGAN